METKTRHLIMKLAEQYEKPEFIADDPVHHTTTVPPPLVMKLNFVGRWNSSRYVTISSATCLHTASGLTTCGSIKPTKEID